MEEGFRFSSDEAKALTDLFDVTNAASKGALARTSTQAVGYSLAETAVVREDQSVSSAGPASIGQKKLKVPEGLPIPSHATVAAQAEREAPKGNEIWTESDLKRKETVEDKREAPTFEIVYRQNTGVEDQYLGMDFTRENSTNCSDDVLVKINLPKARSVRDIQLDCKGQVLDLRSPEYKLSVRIPKVVLENKVTAKWDAKSTTLTVTLPVDRSLYKVQVIS